MYFYRGDNRGATDKTIQTEGFTAKPPNVTMSGAEARACLTNKLADKKVLDLGVLWRASTPGGMIATAMTISGTFEQMKLLYQIEIPDSELTACDIGERAVLGEQFALSDAPTRNTHFIIYNGSTYQEATIIAFCHGIVNTKEATFLTAIPRKYIKGFRYKTSTVKTVTDAKTGLTKTIIRNDIPFAPMLKVGVHIKESDLTVPKPPPKRIIIPNIFQKDAPKIANKG